MSTRRTKPPGAYVGKEDAFQKTAIGLVRSIASGAGVDHRAVMHIPNGGQRNAIVAAKLKAQGTVAGYPDIMVFEIVENRLIADSLSGYYMGLAIELKVWPNKPTPEQLAIHEILRDAGWRVAVCYGLGEVDKVAREYFGR